MATTKPRQSITFEPDVAEIIEDYRHKHKIKTTSKAVVELLEKGINEFYKIHGKDELTEKEYEHIKKYRALDERGKTNVDNLLDAEYQYIVNQQKQEPYQPSLIAAHNDAEWTEADERDKQKFIEKARKIKEEKA